MVTRVAGEHVLIVTGLLVTQTRAAQTSASSDPVGTLGIDVANSRVFVIALNSITSLQEWQFMSSTAGLSGQQTMIWGGAGITTNANPKILDAYGTTRNPAAVVGGITAINFTTLSNLVVLRDCRIEGVRWTRLNTTGAIGSVGLYRAGLLIGTTFSIAAAGPTVGSHIFAAPIALSAVDRVGCQGTFSTATTTQFIVEALILPPA